MKRGDIYYADLSPVVGSEQGGVRPVLIVQNDTGNRYSPTVIAAAITSQTNKAKLPTQIYKEEFKMKHSIVITSEKKGLATIPVRQHIKRCITAALDVQGVDVPCEINVLVTDDAGIRADSRRTAGT